jgi:hypothetical protein
MIGLLQLKLQLQHCTPAAMGHGCTCDRDGTPTTQNSLLEKTFVKVGRFAFSVAGAKPALACRF